MLLCWMSKRSAIFGVNSTTKNCHLVRYERKSQSKILYYYENISIFIIQAYNVFILKNNRDKLPS